MKIFFKFLILFCSFWAFAQEQVPERPNPPKLVNILFTEPHDFIDAAQIENLEQKLSEFAKNTSNQICIVGVDNLNGAEPVQYATWLGQKWGVGQKDKRNGVVILVKLPSQKDPKRNLFIAVGYGLEGAIPDLLTKKIRENEILPYFKSGDFYTGLQNGTDALMKAAKGEYNEKVEVNNNSGSALLIIILIIIVLIIISKFASKNRRSGGGGMGGFTYFDGGFFNGIGGGSSGSSDSGGGWDFGGGDFGGGGSGGDW